MATFKCRVVSAREELYVGDIKMLIATGHDGELGILAGHTPLITLLKPGVLRLKKPNDDLDEIIYVQGGILEVQPHIVTVLADAAEHASTLDEMQILEARREAEQQLANQKDTLQVNAALVTLAETLAQLQTIKKYQNRV